MSEPVWVRVTTCDNVPVREGRAVTLGEREIAIFNLGPSPELGAGDRFVATANQCPHDGGPLCDGIVTGMAVVCPLHAWRVNLVSGAVERPGAATAQCVETFAVRVEDGVIVVRLPTQQTSSQCPKPRVQSPHTLGTQVVARECR